MFLLAPTSRLLRFTFFLLPFYFHVRVERYQSTDTRAMPVCALYGLYT